MSGPSPSQAPLLLWFRQDLRLADHPALSAAVASGQPVIPVYILDEETAIPWAPGGASRWWLAGSLEGLSRDLEARGSRLVLRRGRADAVLGQLADATKAAGVIFTRRYEPQHRAEEEAIAADFSQRGLSCRRFGGSLLFEPEAVANKAGQPFRVFTPFYKACLARSDIKAPLPAPSRVQAPARWPTSEGLADWCLRPTSPDWARGLRQTWQPGSNGAERRLANFLEGPIGDYAEDRDRPDRHGTSSLSPHLHFGEISPRQIWHHAHYRAEENGGQAFLRELIWREFSYHLLHHWPKITEQAFNPKFANFPWQEDAFGLQAWQRGETGYPIVDAGMRQLWVTGWMHNRVRMIVASFLTKHLLISWQAGARWFWDTLVDADLANNSASWQWVAGCGADAAPYFRIFNPVLQGRKFDPEGRYLRQWLPALAGLPDRFVHTPWEAGSPPADYPAPIVDHAFARARALEAYAETRQR